MAKYIILYGVVVLVVSLNVIRVARGPKEPSQIPCDTCKYLVRKGGYYKYYCGNQQAQGGFSDRFDKPPEYCGFWERRGGDINDQR